MKQNMSEWWEENRELVYTESAVAVAAVLIGLLASSYQKPKAINTQKTTTQSVNVVNHKTAGATANFYNFVKSKTR